MHNVNRNLHAVLQNATFNVIKKSDWNKIYISGTCSQLWCPEVILKTISMTNTSFVTFLWPSLGHRHSVMTFFLLLSLLQISTVIVMTNSGWNKIMSASRALLWWSKVRLKQLVPIITGSVTFCATNSWSVTWSWHFLSVIITIVTSDCCACEWFQETKWT